jgi:PAS domain S-box-containing protein
MPQQTFEIKLLTLNGETKWALLSAAYIKYRGRFAIMVTLVDITERKRAERALSESEANLARAQAISHVGNWYCYPLTDVVLGSDEFFHMLGIPRQEKFSFSEFLKLVHPDDRANCKASFDEAMSTHEFAHSEFRIVRPDGKERIIFRDGRFGLDEEGKPRVFGTMQDITERKRTEEELANAKARAEVYLDLMGHDINNFNQTARGYLELIGSMTEDEKLKQLVSRPMEAIDSSSRLIQNVQKLQRGRSGECKPETYDLGALVEEVTGQLESAPDRHVRIDCITIKGIYVQANELLRDVFVNLIGNAIKHSTGSSHIDIRMVPEKKDRQSYCSVIIDDNGPGVPDDMKEKIFDRLSRGNTKAKGSGLGLYLVKTLVENYGGKVWAEDRVPGDRTKGARFVVKLPAVEKPSSL